ncbi:hypothetical protein DH2020_010139 [Rehmannia glutinosa]|uniref:T-ag OBD domain-containing protein n=1 Tax=Rehmannia glutinosa TaxID=99300 RepID=A0ABR0X992_REHGL
MEAVGVVTAVGPGLTGRKVGDLVAYAGNPMGAYAEEQILPAEKVVPVPPSIDPIIAASVMLKGMTAQFLVRQCFKVERGHTVLIHAAAGGVGSLLCQWANALGATVIGTVSTKAKAAQAKDDGCHHVILYKEEDFVTRVNEITSGKGVEVVYDSVGKDTFEVMDDALLLILLSGSLACLKLRGYMVNFGQSSGTPDPVPLSALAAKSLFLTRPTLMHYTVTRDELLQTASEVFTNVGAGVLRVRVNHTYPLSQAAQAHADLENRKTSGSVVLIPDGYYGDGNILQKTHQENKSIHRGCIAAKKRRSKAASPPQTTYLRHLHPTTVLSCLKVPIYVFKCVPSFHTYSKINKFQQIKEQMFGD